MEAIKLFLIFLALIICLNVFFLIYIKIKKNDSNILVYNPLKLNLIILRCIAYGFFTCVLMEILILIAKPIFILDSIILFIHIGILMLFLTYGLKKYYRK